MFIFENMMTYQTIKEHLWPYRSLLLPSLVCIYTVFVVGEVLSYDLMDGPNPPRRIMQLKMIKKT